MNATLRRIGKPILEIALPQVERLTGFRTAAGDYLPHRLQMLVGTYEAEELGLIRRFLRPGQTIIDAGANIGYTVRFFADAVGETGCVYAFEPNPVVFPLLQQNTANVSHVRCFNLGLSAKAGDTILYLAGKNHSVASFSEQYPSMHLADRPNETVSPVRVEVVKGDDFIRSLNAPPIDVIKMDVEGWELNVLNGFEQTIQQSPGITLFCEYSPAAQKCAGHSPRALLDWLWDHQFCIQYPKNGDLCSLSPDSIDEFITHVVAHDYTTIFATPGQHSS